MPVRQAFFKMCCLLLLALFVPSVHAEEASPIPLVDNLQAVASKAQKEKKPVLVLFEADGCPYCKRVMQEFLNPMSRNKEYQGKVSMVRVDISSQRTLVDFQGNKTTAGNLAKNYRASLTPTVMLFGADGKPLENPIVGFRSPDYYGYYLDNAIDASVAKVRGQKLSLR